MLELHDKQMNRHFEDKIMTHIVKDEMRDTIETVEIYNFARNRSIRPNNVMSDIRKYALIANIREEMREQDNGK